MGVYNLYNIIQSLGGKNSLIITGYSVSPYTSLINKNDLLNKLRNTSGIENITFLVISLGYVNGKDVAFIGNNNVSDAYCAYPSYYVKNELNLKINQTILVYPALSNFPIILKVCNFSNLYPWAISVNINTAYLIHGGGINYGLASLAIIDFKNSSYKLSAMKSLSLTPVQKSLINTALILVQNNQGEKMLFNEASQAYFNKLGIPKIAFLSLAIASALIISIASYTIGLIFNLIDKDRIEILNNYGISKMKIMFNSIAISLLLLLISFIISLFIFNKIKYLLSTNLLGLPLIPSINIYIMLSTLISIMVISTISIIINNGDYNE